MGPWYEILAILVAGVWAGAINTIVGSGTLVTFPTLVAFGYPPVVATMSNAVGLIPGNVAGTWGYRHEMAGHWRRFLPLLPASLAGAVTGAFLLLTLPDDAFETIVPVLLALALVLVIFQPRIQAWVRARKARLGQTSDVNGRQFALMLVLVYLTGTYGGYFAAAQGILLIGVLGTMLPDPLQRLNAVKNVSVLGVNLVAGLTYTVVAFDRIEWPVVGLIAVGSVIGGLLGARIGRRLSPAVLRGCIVALGIVAIVRILTV
jgi:uncharacterized protein